MLGYKWDWIMALILWYIVLLLLSLADPKMAGTREPEYRPARRY